jgi:SLT domain-containing protein
LLSNFHANSEQFTQGGIKAVQAGIGSMGTLFEQLGKHNKDAFNAAKAFNIANAIMNTAMGITKALSTLPVPFNFIAAAAVGAAGFAQVAAIRSQQYTGRQLGGPVQEGKSFLVGETGPEIFTPNASGRIDRMDSLGGQNVNINFNIQAVDTQGFDELLVSRRGVIQQVISDAMLESGQRSRY